MYIIYAVPRSHEMMGIKMKMQVRRMGMGMADPVRVSGCQGPAMTR